MLRWQTETQRACEAYDWLVVETRGDDAAGWGCHLVYRGDRWGIAPYRHALVERALARPAFARSIIRPLASEVLARAAFTAAPTTPPPRLADPPAQLGAIVRWPSSSLLLGEAGDALYSWDVESGALVDRLPTDGILTDGFSFTQLAIAPPLVATRDGAYDLAVWHLPSRTKRAVLTGHPSEVGGVAFAGEHIITCCSDRILRMWSVERGELVRKLDVEHPMWWVVRRPQGGLLACGGMIETMDDGVVVIVDEALAHVRTIVVSPVARRRDAAVSCLAWHPDGRHLAVGGDQFVRLVDVETGESVRTWHVHGDLITALAVDADRVISADLAGVVRISAYDDDVTCFGEYQLDGKMIEDLVIDGDHIYASSETGNVYVLP